MRCRLLRLDEYEVGAKSAPHEEANQAGALGHRLVHRVLEALDAVDRMAADGHHQVVDLEPRDLRPTALADVGDQDALLIPLPAEADAIEQRQLANAELELLLAAGSRLLRVDGTRFELHHDVRSTPRAARASPRRRSPLLDRAPQVVGVLRPRGVERLAIQGEQQTHLESGSLASVHGRISLTR
jgi:hypothetical protein